MNLSPYSPELTDFIRRDREKRAAVRQIKAASRADLPRIVKLKDTRTCANCAQSESKDPKCGLCCSPTSTITRWEPKP